MDQNRPGLAGAGHLRSGNRKHTELILSAVLKTWRLNMSLIGIDVGTSGVKVILLEADGRIAANVTEEYPVSQPYPLWSEQSPEDWWQATCRAVNRALAEADVAASDIKGIGLSGQMVGLVVLDKHGEVLRPCILWNDQRSVQETEELTAAIGLEKILKETSNPLFATFVGPKLVWMSKHEPDKYERIRHVLMPKDYIVYRLTGHIGTEVSDASGTCLFNVRQRQWSQEMIQAMDIPKEWLPICTESDEIVGTVTDQAARQSGVSPGTPVAAGAGDQPAQALGSGIVRPGLCSVTIGTSGVVFAQGDRHIEHPTGLLHSFCHSVHNQWYLMGVMLSAGGSFQWLRDTFGSLATLDYDKMTDLAAQVPPGSEGLIFLPYLTGERVPYDDPRARGGWIGLTQRHRPAHLIRAVMEGITFGLCDSLKLINELGLPIERVYASGGAVRSELWLQMLADVFETEIVTTNVTEGAAYGAAMLAGIGIKRYTNAAEAADALIKVSKTVEPNPKISRIYSDNYAVYRSLYPKLKNTFAELTELTNKQAEEVK
jgi:xylulokinase